eukprot:gene10385-10543_t
MNPGGDFGKKELSPALSNRFTQIWVPAITDEAELLAILESRLATSVIIKSVISHHLLAFWRLFVSQAPPAAQGCLSVLRDAESSSSSSTGSRFNWGAPTTCRNAYRLLRAMQLRKAVLLEGSPGVGKTSLVAALARSAGAVLVRINCSEHTDMIDLLGADLPAPGGAAGQFTWSDGPLLAAVKAGQWVLLDELNLAGQSVLEGLNGLLDHRQALFVPELSQSFRAHTNFRLFAAQNPLQEGGGRKGLPKSFLNSDELLDYAVEHFAGILFTQRLRTASDRQQLLSLFAQACATGAAAGPPSVSQQQRARTTSSIASSGSHQRGELLLPSWQAPLLESVVAAASAGWMVLLVGPGGSGKTSLARLAAQLVGVELQELALTQGTDTSDLLGSFEQVSGRFEWVDGSLTRAIQQGSWVLLDNANLVNPTVLDRLNALLEPNGVLQLDEAGGVQGSAGPGGGRVVVPHPGFRLLLAYDPKHGEKQQAAGAHQGLEEEVPQPTWCQSGLSDLEAVLSSCGGQAAFLQLCLQLGLQPPAEAVQYDTVLPAMVLQQQQQQPPLGSNNQEALEDANDDDDDYGGDDCVKMELQLVVPPPGVDPAGRYGYKSAALQRWVRQELEPSIQVRVMLQQLPGGPDSSAALLELRQQRAALLLKLQGLGTRRVPRPEPPQYLHLQRESVKEYEAQAAAEAAQLFKHKTQTSTFLTEEEEAEADYQQQFPDHFAAFADLADRLFGLPLTVPLKQALTGLELLLARAQVWEETAAKHVSLKQQLTSIAGLATRWRKLELASWKGLLDRVQATHAAGAYQSWYHLYRLLILGQAADGEVIAAPAVAATDATEQPTTTTTSSSSSTMAYKRVAALVEAFIQTSTGYCMPEAQAGEDQEGGEDGQGELHWEDAGGTGMGEGELTEQLRLILEPSLASRLGGEYKSGKRLNMKRVIGYIASQFRRDKIWMRRSRPDKRRYQVLVAVDDSKSMAENGAACFALEALALLCKAMSRLEVGELGVISYGGAAGVQPLQPLESVKFVDGKPVFERYLDTFPFPYYIVLRDIAALPATLADLLRQWFELNAASS